MSDETLTVVELGPDPDDATIRACVEAIRSGGKVKLLAGAYEPLLHAIVRYANGLGPAAVGDESWQRVVAACGVQAGYEAAPLEQTVNGIAVALTTASEYLLAAALALNPALVELLREQFQSEEETK